MKLCAKKMIAWALSLTLLVTCAVSGLVLPTAAESANLFVNGDFEQGATAQWQSSALVVAGAGKDGGYGYYHNRTETSEWTASGQVRYKSALLTQMEAGAEYILTFDYKTSGSALGQFFFDKVFGTTDADKTMSAGFDLPKNVTEWTTQTIRFTTPATITANSGWEFSIRTRGGAGEVWYDNFCLEKVPETPESATAIALNKTSTALTVGGSETLTVLATPAGAALGTVTWTTSDEAVATVNNGVITAVGAGAATITATAGTLTATCAVTVTAPAPSDFVVPNGDFEQGTASGWKYSDKSDVPVLTDTDGNKYIQIPANGATIIGPAIDYKVQAGDWFRLSFKVRKNAAGKARPAVRLYNVFSGYAQPDWILSAGASDTSGDGEWFTYNLYAEADITTSNFYLVFQQIANNSTVDLTLDLDDIELEMLPAGTTVYDLNLFHGGDFEDGNIASLDDYSHGGLFNDGGVIVADPDDAANHVLYFDGTGTVQSYFYNDFTVVDKTNIRLKKNEIYKLTYRQKGTGTTSPSILAAGGGTRLSLEGDPSTASDEWKTITAYYLINPTNQNTNYAFDFRTSGNVYIDDFTMTRVAQATSIELNKTTATLTVGNTETLTATVKPTDAYMQNAVTWSSDNEAVATVADGVITAVSAGTATITATAGTLTVTCTVTVEAVPTPDPEPSGELAMPNGDFNAATSGWVYNSTVDGLFNKGDAVPVLTDTDGNKYIQIPANGKSILSPTVTCDIKAGDWIRVDFKVRKNEAGKMRFGIQVYGAVSGYLQPDWFISTSDTGTSGDGTWFTYTFYTKAAQDATQFYLGALEIAGNTKADVKLDLDDVKIKNLGAVEESSLPIFSNGTMDETAAEFNDYGYGGLFNDGGEIVTDPDDATNKVLHMTSAGIAYFYPNLKTYKAGTSNKTVGYKANTVYKLTYRMKGTGTTSVDTTAAYATVLETIGAPGTASAEWKTITAYVKMTASPNNAYGLVFRTNGDVYLDDVIMTEVTDVDTLSLDKTTVEEMMPGDEVILTATTAPSGYTVTWTTSDETVATVENGKVVAVGEGTATITATAGTKTATCTVTVKDAGKATEIKLDKTEAYLVKGETLTLTVITVPEASRYDSLTWSSNDTTLATVANGVVTAAADKEGEVTITATAMVNGAPLTATCKVTVVGNATSIEANVETLHLAPAISATLNASETIELTVSPTGAYTGTLTWTSSDTTVATVDANGKVTAHAEGTATITVTNGTLTDTVVVTVDVFGERITGGDFEGDDWNTAYWTYAIIKDGRGQLVADPKDPTNTVLAIPANATGGWYMWPLMVNPGRTYKLTYKAMSEAGKTEVYFESSKAVSNGGWKQRTIAKDGWVEVTEIFTMYGSDINRNYTVAFGNHWGSTLYIDDFSVVELPEATDVSIVPGGEIKLMPSGTMTLTATTTPAEASIGSVTWTSSAPNVVAVSDKGVITAVANSGSAVITLTNDKGLTDSVTVTIDEYANLLENGDFEAGYVNWKNADTKVLPGIGKDGSYGYRVQNTGTGSRYESYYAKAIPAQPATTYILTFDYYATPSSKSLRIFSNTLGIGSLYAANGTGEWKTATKIFTTPASMKLNNGWDLAIVCDGKGSEDIVIDNISVKLYNSGVEAESIALNYTEMTLMPGRTNSLKISATPINGDINRSVWSSSDENVATVEYGVVTAVGKGTATITATTRSGLTATCKVTVAGTPAIIKNGTFDIAGDTSWQLSGGSTIAAEDGIMNSAAGSIVKDSSISQSVVGLKPETTYQLFVRYRSAVTGKLGIALASDESTLLEKSESTAAAWTNKVYEFTTGETVDELSTLIFSVDSGNGPIFIDHVMLAEKASLVDLVVDSIVWDGGDEQVKPGTKLTFAVTFSNKGEDPVKAGASFNIDVCMDGKAIQTLTYTAGPAGMAPGTTELLLATESWEAVEGDHIMSVRINPTLSVLEMNTDNNNKVQTLLRVSDTALPVPELAELAGFTTLGFSEDFDSLDTIDMYGTGADGYKWYVTRPYSAPNVETDDYEINDGVMTLKLSTPSYNYGLGTMDIHTGIGYEFNFGYMEFRIRMHDYDSNGVGGPAIWSLPYDKLVNKCTRWVEMDWMEYWGTPSYAKDGRYTVTLHDNSTADDPDGEHWYRNPNHADDAFGDQEWHTLGYVWDYGKLIAYLDGEVVMALHYTDDEGSTPMATVSKGDPLKAVDAFTPMNTQYLPFTICGSLDNQMDIDYIRVWTGHGGGGVPGDKVEGDEDGDDDDDNVVVDMEAEDFWYNYCTDIWGDPIAAVDGDNYQNVLFGKEIWEQLSDERKAEINALLKSYGQASYDEMLADALIIEGGELPDKEPDQIPDTGDSARAIPAVAGLVLLSAAAIWMTRKRKR